jgi:hypothetical protein
VLALAVLCCVSMFGITAALTHGSRRELNDPRTPAAGPAPGPVGSKGASTHMHACMMHALLHACQGQGAGARTPVAHVAAPSRRG